MFWEILINLCGSVVFLFILWHRLKEDYSHKIILDTGFLVIVGLILSQLISKFFLPAWWFWLAVGVGSLALGFSIYRNKLKLFETIDAAVSGIFPWLLLVFLYSSVSTKNIYTLGGFFVILAIYLLYHFLNSQYKKFSWYHSGKVGFSGLTTIGTFFLFRTFAGTLLTDMLSFVGKEDMFISGLLAFLAFLGVFHLSRQYE